MLMNRDDLFIDLALRARLLTQAQVEDCRKLRGLLQENRFSLPLSEIAARKEFLNPAQVRLLNVAIRYEETRAEDAELADFIVRKGFLPPERIDECLALQEQPFKEGRHFPRLDDLLVEKGYLSPQQVHVVLRAREQLEASKDAGSSPRVPRLRPSMPPEAALPEPPSSAPPPRPSPAGLKAAEEGLTLETLRIAMHRSRGTGDPGVVVLDLDGALDGHTSRPFDEYLGSLIAAGATQVVLGCKKLTYVSSAGVGVLAGGVKRCRAAQGDLRLCEIPEKVRKVMHLVGLLSVVRTYEQERGAVLSFKYG